MGTGLFLGMGVGTLIFGSGERGGWAVISWGGGVGNYWVGFFAVGLAVHK